MTFCRRISVYVTLSVILLSHKTGCNDIDRYAHKNNNKQYHKKTYKAIFVLFEKMREASIVFSILISRWELRRYCITRRSFAVCSHTTKSRQI